jgi:hypothetical protein
MPIEALIIVAWLALVAAEASWRFVNGSSLRSLYLGAFDELRSLQWYLYALVCLSFVSVMGCALLTARGIWALVLYNDLAGAVDWSFAIWALYPAALGAGLFFFGFSVRRWMIGAREHRMPIAIDLQEISGEIDDSEIANLGAEKFPDGVRHRLGRSVLVRLLLLVAALGGAALAWFPDLSLQLGVSAPVNQVIAAITNFYFDNNLHLTGQSRGADLLIPYAAACLLGLFTVINSSYLYFSAGRMVVLTLGLMAACLYSTIFLEDATDIRLAIGAIIALPSIRIVIDLATLVRHVGRHARIDPISTALHDVFRADLAALTNSATSAYGPPRTADLVERIARGADKVGKEAFLAPPRLVRYMRAMSVKWRRCATVIARFMTVRRSVALVNPRPTREALRHPEVPLWNEILFPLRAPSGYVTQDDSKRLGDEYCVVQNCSGCHGSGKVACSHCHGSGSTSRTETRTETRYVDGETVTVSKTVTISERCHHCGASGRVTCHSCTGTGRTKFDQELTTSWRADAVYAPYPEMISHELVAGAEEFDFATLRVVEDRRGLTEPARAFADDGTWHQGLDGRMQAAAGSVPNWSKLICRLHGGTVYRAELTLSGFTTLRCSFRTVFRHSGWFFGKHPAFYFPRPPIDFAVLGATVVVPAMVVLTLLFGVGLFSEQWDAVERAAYAGAQSKSPAQPR